MRYAEATDIEPIEFRIQADKNRQSSTNSVGVLYQDLDTFYLNTRHENERRLSAMESAMRSVALSLDAYNQLLDVGIAKETARFILPLATQTMFYMSGTIRSWIHMINLREDPHSQLEAQLIATEMRNIFCSELPIISKALGWTK